MVLHLSRDVQRVRQSPALLARLVQLVEVQLLGLSLADSVELDVVLLELLLLVLGYGSQGTAGSLLLSVQSLLSSRLLEGLGEVLLRLHQLRLSLRVWVLVWQLLVAGDLVLWVEWVAYPVGGGSLLERACSGSLDVVRLVGPPEVLPLVVLSEDPQSLGAGLGSHDVLSPETGEQPWVLPGRRHAHGLAALHVADLDYEVVLVPGGVAGVERVGGPLGDELRLGDVRVVVGVEAVRALPLLVSELSLRALDVVDLHDLPRLDVVLLHLFRSRSVNVVDFHVVAHIPRWSYWSLLNLGQLVTWIQGIST